MLTGCCCFACDQKNLITIINIIKRINIYMHIYYSIISQSICRGAVKTIKSYHAARGSHVFSLNVSGEDKDHHSFWYGY